MCTVCFNILNIYASNYPCRLNRVSIYWKHLHDCWIFQRTFVQLQSYICLSFTFDEDLMSHINVTFCHLCSRTQWTHDEPCLPDDGLLDMGMHVGALGFKIWKNLQSHVKYCE